MFYIKNVALNIETWGRWMPTFFVDQNFMRKIKIAYLKDKVNI